jgi:hypothetical protein
LLLPKIHHHFGPALVIPFAAMSTSTKMKPGKATVKSKSNARSRREKRDEDVMNVRNTAKKRPQCIITTHSTNLNDRQTTAVLSQKDVYRSFISAMSQIITSLLHQNSSGAIHLSIVDTGFECMQSSKLFIDFSKKTTTSRKWS